MSCISLITCAILIVLSSEKRYGIRFSDLQFHTVVELGLHSLKVNENLLSSIQFRAAKMIMKTNVNMSKSWVGEPINDFVNR